MRKEKSGEETFLNPIGPETLDFSNKSKIKIFWSEAYSGICPVGGLIFFIFPGGAQHPLGPENPLKSIEFTGPGRGLAHIAPPLNTPLTSLFINE